MFLLTVKTKQRSANHLFAFFLLANAIDACKYVITDIPESLIKLKLFAGA
jgi:hypothetical protein